MALCYPQATLVNAEGDNRTIYDDVLHLVQNDPADRFLSLVLQIKLAHQHLGLIRTSHLRQTHLLGTHVGSDINLLAELTLYGKFFELPQRLFFRRLHKDSGSWKRDDPDHQARQYLAANSGKDWFQTWRSDLSFFAAVQRSPLPPASKMRIYRHLTQHTVWHWRHLMSELFHS